MKAFFSVLLLVGYVTGRGSGPYLPSGWKPAGPSFYLPSEIQPKPADNPIKEVIFESEPAGSDSLREYGPPKVQEVSQDINNQGLPDKVTDQTFLDVEKAIETGAVVLEVTAVEDKKEEKPVEEKPTEEKLIEEKPVEENPIVKEAVIAEEKTDSQLVAVVEEKVEVESQTTSLAEQPLQDSVFESTERTVEATVVSVEAVVAEEEQSAVTEVSEVKVEEGTKVLETSEKELETKVSSIAESQKVDIAEVTQEVLEEVTKEVNAVVSEEIKAVEEVKSTLSEEVKEVEEIKSAVSEEIKEVENVKETVAEEIKSVEEVKTVISEEVKVLDEITQAVAEVLKEVEKEVEKTVVAEEVKVADEVKTVENVVVEEAKSVVAGVNNIAQALAAVESEIKAEKAEKTTTLELAGSLADAPEGFLEYGPPGFREYGPPKDDELLRTNALEQESNETNEARRRRFSPKFKPAIRPVSKRNH